VGAVKAPTIQRSYHADGHDNRVRHCQVGLQVHGVDAAGEVVIRRQLKRRSVLAFFQKLPPCLVGIEALRLVSLLVSRTPGARPYRAINATGLRKALRQAAEERYGRC
jgi:transposase